MKTGVPISKRSDSFVTVRATSIMMRLAGSTSKASARTFLLPSLSVKVSSDCRLATSITSKCS